jgi:hypothetical protein
LRATRKFYDQRKNLSLEDSSRQGAKSAKVGQQFFAAPSTKDMLCVPSARLRTCFAGDIPNLWLRQRRAVKSASEQQSLREFNNHA